MRLLLICLAAVLAASAALSAPQRYTLDREASSVGFEVSFGPDEITGTIPVETVDLVLDFDRAANSRAAVRLDSTGAKANFPFATQALRGPTVLSSSQFPAITFASTNVLPAPDGAVIEGEITIRDVTRPLTLAAEIFRPAGTQPGDRENLTLRLTGAVQRSAFGADGWSDLVGDEVRLRIIARVSQANE